jgi:cellulase/cellobiase CelA1
MGHNNPLSDRVKGAIAVINDMNFKSKLLPIKIKINGIFFFDFKHGQTGVAKNGGELHPVLHIELLE